MKNTTQYITGFLLLFLPLFATAQATNNDCPFYKKYIQTGDVALKKKDFEKAINAYSTAMVHCPSQAKVASRKIKMVFKAINQQRIEAEQAKERATKSEKKALVEKEKAVKAQKVAYSNQLAATSSNAFYVYNNNSDALHIAKAALDSAYTPAAALALSTAYYKMFDNGILLAANWQEEKDSIYTAVFSPDGQHILTSSYQKNIIQIWNLQGQLISTFSNGNPRLTNAQYSPNGKFILTISNESIAQIWNLKGEKIVEIPYYPATYSLAPIQFSEDGNHLLVIEKEQQLAVYDINKGTFTRLESDLSRIATAQFSSDGQFVLANSDDEARLWNVEGVIKKSWKQLKGKVHLVENSNYLICREQVKYDEDNKQDSIKIWDINGQLIQQFSKEGLGASKMRFSPNHNHILTYQDSNAVQLRTFKGEILNTLPINDEVVFQGFSTDNQHILTQTKGNQSIKIWNLEGQFVTELDIDLDISMLESYFVPHFTVSSDGQHILITRENEVGERNNLEVWNKEGKQVIDFLKQGCTGMNLPIFSPDGKYILADCFNRKELWTTQAAIAINESKGMESTFFSPNRQFFIKKSVDNIIQLRSIKKDFITDLKKVDDASFEATFSSDGEYFVLNVANQPLSLWNIDGDYMTNLKGDYKNITTVNFASDGASILASVQNDKAMLWNLKGELITHLDTQAVFLPNQEQILTTTKEQPIKLWNVQGQFVKALDVPSSIALTHFSPKMQYILTKSNAGFTQLWSKNGTLIHTFEQKVPISAKTRTYLSSNQYYLTYKKQERYKNSWKAGRFIQEQDDLGSGLSRAIFSTKEKYLLIENRLYDTQGRFINQLGNSKEFSDVKFSSEDEYILTLSSTDNGNSTITLWDTKGNLIKEFDKLWQPFFRVEFAPKTDYFTITSSSSATVYNKEGHFIKKLEGVEWFDGNITYSPDGQILLFLGCNPHNCESKIHLWNLQDGFEADLNKHTAAIHRVKFSPDGKYILTASYDMTIKLWDLKGNLLASLDKYGGYSSLVLFSSDSQYIITQASMLRTFPIPQVIYQYLDREPLPLLTEGKLRKYGMK